MVSRPVISFSTTANNICTMEQFLNSFWEVFLINLATLSKRAVMLGRGRSLPVSGTAAPGCERSPCRPRSCSVVQSPLGRRPLPPVRDLTRDGRWSTYDVSVLKKMGGGGARGMRTDRRPSEASSSYLFISPRAGLHFSVF